MYSDDFVQLFTDGSSLYAILENSHSSCLPFVWSITDHSLDNTVQWTLSEHCHSITGKFSFFHLHFILAIKFVNMKLRNSQHIVSLIHYVWSVIF